MALREVHGVPLAVEIEVGVGEADSVAEGEVEASVVEVAVAVVGSLPVEAGGDLLPGGAAEVNFTLLSINKFAFYEALYYIKVSHRNFLSVFGSTQRPTEIDTRKHISPKLPNFKSLVQ